MAEISILCKRTVVSTKPVQAGKFYSLSILDRIMETNNLRIVYYYQFPFEIELGSTTKKLRESISEMLTSFPIMTGRLQKSPEGHWMIKCNDAGVRMIEARASGSVEEWLQTADREQELKLIYWEDMFHKPYFWSTFYVQLTEFEGGGIAVGFSCTHLLADASCATMLIKAWADTTLLGRMIRPPHFHPLPSGKIGDKDIKHNPHTELIDFYRSSLERPIPIAISSTEKYATVTFAFTDEMVRKCMTETQVGGDDLSSTPFAALAAIFWVSVSKVKGKREGLVNLSLCLDMRNVLGLDQGFFGNCMVFNKVCGEELEEAELGNAAKAICAVMRNMGNEGIMDLIEWLESNKIGDEKSRHQSHPIDGPDLLCANWETLDPYSAVFESGVEPIRVSYYFEQVFGEGQVLILPAPKGEGSLSRVAMVTLPEEQAIGLCEEALILSFSPTILMGVKKYQV